MRFEKIFITFVVFLLFSSIGFALNSAESQCVWKYDEATHKIVNTELNVSDFFGIDNKINAADFIEGYGLYIQDDSGKNYKTSVDNLKEVITQSDYLPKGRPGFLPKSKIGSIANFKETYSIITGLNKKITVKSIRKSLLPHSIKQSSIVQRNFIETPHTGSLNKKINDIANGIITTCGYSNSVIDSMTYWQKKNILIFSKDNDLNIYFFDNENCDKRSFTELSDEKLNKADAISTIDGELLMFGDCKIGGEESISEEDVIYTQSGQTAVVEKKEILDVIKSEILDYKCSDYPNPSDYNKCTYPNIVEEFNCNGELINHTARYCHYGEICSNGACVDVNQINCIDTDGYNLEKTGYTYASTNGQSYIMKESDNEFLCSFDGSNIVFDGQIEKLYMTDNTMYKKEYNPDIKNIKSDYLKKYKIPFQILITDENLPKYIIPKTIIKDSTKSIVEVNIWNESLVGAKEKIDADKFLELMKKSTNNVDVNQFLNTLKNQK